MGHCEGRAECLIFVECLTRDETRGFQWSPPFFDWKENTHRQKWALAHMVEEAEAIEGIRKQSFVEIC